MTNENKIKILTAKKETLFARIQRAFENSKHVSDAAGLNTFITRCETLDETKQEFYNLVESINQLSLQDKSTFIPNFAEIDAFDELYCHIKMVLKNVSIQKTLDSSSSTSNNSQLTEVANPTRSLPRLPKIPLVSFSGEIKDWPVFSECFRSLIHDNPSLTDVDRVHYLIGQLSGKALTVCAGIPPTGANYSLFWKALNEKYEDKRLLANHYLDQIFDFKAAVSESATALNHFLNNFDSSAKALKKLNIENLDDYILSYLALKKLDPETNRLFENTRRLSSLPSYEEIIKFVSEQAKICSRSPFQNKQSTSNSSSFKSKFSHSFVNTQKSENTSKCPICNLDSHSIYSCNKLLNMKPNERYKVIKEKSLCLNCFGRHRIIHCSSNTKCRHCKKMHHSLLHFDNSNKPLLENYSANSSAPHHYSTVEPKPSPSSSIENASSSSDSKALNFCSTNEQVVGNTTVLLSTAIVHILDQYGHLSKARFLLDSASQRHLLTTKCCRRLNIPFSKISSTLHGLGVSTNIAKGQAKIVIASCFDPSKRYPMDTLVIENITDQLPHSLVKLDELTHIRNLPLADSTFHQPGEIDGIIGAQLYAYLLGPNRIVGPPHLPVAIETTLGYILSGTAPIISTFDIVNNFCTLADLPLENMVQKFWELEEIPITPVQDVDDEACEAIFQSTYSRQPSGKYTVSLPFKLSPFNLGDSYSVALRRFSYLEKRFRKDPKFKESYSQVIKEHLDAGYIRKAIDNNFIHPTYYIPHHGIFKSNSTTPLRIVYDASAASTNSFSLNDLLHAGPKLQTDVLTVFLNYRLFKFALTADIRKMYLQIEMCEDHKRFQRILWRASETEPISIYELNTVSFGVKSSPFLALRTVRQLAADESTSFPLASKFVREYMYIDDFVGSIDNFTKAKLLYQDMVNLFKAGGFELTKWAVNSKELLEFIPPENRAPNLINFATDFLKVLGLQWHPSSDYLSFKLNIEARECTKRNILSLAARLFDPLGLIAPITLKLKLFIKQLWLLNINWDETPPDNFVSHWIEFVHDLNSLINFKVPRHLGIYQNSNSIFIVGFADACQTSYGAVVYLRTASHNKIETNLVCAKSKVSPLKVISIPRLELCATLLLAKLINFVIKALSRIKITKIYALSDSTVTLNWINSHPSKWKTFVANRVTKIQELIPSFNWFHIDGKLNISDGLSRGLSPSQFLNLTEWIQGPNWLQMDESQWPIKSINSINRVSLEEKSLSFVVNIQEVNPLYGLIERCSSWTKLVRSTVFILRFLKRLPVTEIILASSLEMAEHTLLKVVQAHHFSDEIRSLKLNKECSPSLRKLRPFLHNDLIRVGGRLANSNLEFDSQHPILLPKRDKIVDLLINHYHSSHFHTGPTLVLSLIRQKYWILAARGTIRNIISKCNYCFRNNPKPQFPVMANLPAYRVQQAKPFYFTGVDFAGPLKIVFSKKRGIQPQKAYICLFVCLSVKAVHIELVSDLSTPNFLQAFKRFLSRRGSCGTMFSDQGTNFLGAKTVLKDLYNLRNTKEFQDSIGSELAHRGIEWKFNPPAAPHMGGIWEANIKSVKTHLYKVVGEQILTYEEMNTLLIQIEALLNSRPLCILSTDPSEPLALTPAHFLTLSPLEGLPSADLSHISNINRLDRFQLIEKMVQDYWKRWHIEYLNTLQTRAKWNSPSVPIELGCVVVLQQQNTPPFQWPLGRIVEVFPGKDGVIRVVSVKTKNGIFKRPVVKVCPLPTQ